MKILNLLSRFYWHYIVSPEKYARHIGVKIGKNCLIETRILSSEPYLITIGNNVQVTYNVFFHTHGGAHTARQKYPQFDVFGKIVVEDWAYIGTNSQIMPGVTIGEGALVAAGSIVTKSVAPHTVVGGNPAKYICTVDEYIDKNLKYNTNTKGLSNEEKKKVLQGLEEEMFVKK
jgi:acetyltransferase-like isoleucine patch superfamily enzyme